MLAPRTSEATWRGAYKAFSNAASTRPARSLTSTPRIPSPIGLHQRKFSSSKAPNASKDESRPITNATKATHTQTKPAFDQTPDALPAPRPRRRKPKDHSSSSAIRQSPAEELNLPSVPSTQQLHPLDVHLASFFSQHRPISITHNIPPSISQEDFASVFSRLKLDPKSKSEDVIQTLSAAVTHLDESVAQHEAPNSAYSEEAEMRAELSQSKSVNATSSAEAPISAGSVAPPPSLDIHDLIKALRPFVPPPAPVPQSARAHTLQQEPEPSPQPTHTTYSSTVTVYETLHPSGHRTFKTVATPITTSPLPPPAHFASSDPSSAPYPPYSLPQSAKLPYIERAKEYRRGVAGIMHLISVKRQRKLKMKKHKHRKLLKRTRNLRRKLDKT